MTQDNLLDFLRRMSYDRGAREVEGKMEISPPNEGSNRDEVVMEQSQDEQLEARPSASALSSEDADSIIESKAELEFAESKTSDVLQTEKELAQETGTERALETDRGEEEEEWDDKIHTVASDRKQEKSSSLDYAASDRTGTGTAVATKSDDDVAEAMLDRTHLCVVRCIVPDLYVALSLVEKELDSAKKDRKSAAGETVGSAAASLFPLNQMTWPELARMSLILKLYEELEKTEEEVSTLCIWE